MKKHLILILILALCTVNIGWTQTNDPVLFTVEGKPVNVSEFDYIYSKSKVDTASYSRASLNEYLELYKNFKLKVQRAKEMKLDTIPSLKQELAGYRKQLANSYLVDKEVTDKLIEEAHDRSLKDVNISHIMIGLSPNATEADVNTAMQKMQSIQNELKAGGDFAALAKKHSEDKNTSVNGGSMGYLNAMFPDGFYNLESAAYNTKVNEVSDIFRTVAGLHLVKTNSIREARGQMEIAHILIRVPKGDDGVKAKASIDSIYQVLKGGADFSTLAKSVSQDKRTGANGGYIGFIGVRHPFEDAAFALKQNGDFSEPVKSAVGWHVVKRISKKEKETLDIAKRRIQTKMQENQRKTKNPKFNRLNNARNTMIARIKRDGKFTEDQTVLNTFINSLDSSFLTYKWKAPKKDKPKDLLFSLGKTGDFAATLGDFMDFCQRNSKRLRMGRRMQTDALVKMLYEEYVDDQCIKFEETQLEDKYPEFRSLMREYEEGILLFEATKILVWDKASQDSVGLQDFYNSRNNVYQWNERAVVSKYTVPEAQSSMVSKLRKKARKCAPDKLMSKVNKKGNILVREEKLYEKGKSTLPDGLDWKKNTVSDAVVNKKNKASTFYKVERMMPVTNKSLKEAKGFVIADYQNYLEKKWIEELKSSYEIKVDEAVFESLIKE